VTPVAIPWSALPDHRCFGCSPQNPVGLQLQFTWRDDGELATTFTLRREHESYPGVVHGGLVGLICDETMGNLILLKTGLPAFTMSMRLRYISPLAVGVDYTCVATLRNGRDNDMDRAASDVLDTSGEAMATATATYRLVELDGAGDRVQMSAADAEALHRAMIEHRRTGGIDATDT
jgi:acyl-coenzyme A thioesterase PaaI-like protein